MSSLSTSEIDGRYPHCFSPKIDEVKDYQEGEAIFKGGMPKFITSDIERDRYYADYVNTYLERSGVIFLLHPYSSNLSKRLVKIPKIYFMDTGLCAYLCRWPNPETLENGAMDGAFLETYAVSEIVKSYYNSGITPNFYYYRDTDKKEIDLLFEEANTLYPVEIKKSMSPQGADKNFNALNKFNKTVAPGVILCLTPAVVTVNRGLFLCPLVV